MRLMRTLGRCIGEARRGKGQGKREGQRQGGGKKLFARLKRHPPLFFLSLELTLFCVAARGRDDDEGSPPSRRAGGAAAGSGMTVRNDASGGRGG